MDDDELIANLAGGDDTAFRELFTRHAPWLAARLRAVLPPPEVEDVLQETFLAVWKNAKTYRPQGQAGGWLWVIARRQAALLLRRRGPAAGPLVDVAEPGADPAEAALARADLEAASTRSSKPGVLRGPGRSARLPTAARGSPRARCTRPACSYSPSAALGPSSPTMASGTPAGRRGTSYRSFG